MLRENRMASPGWSDLPSFILFLNTHPLFAIGIMLVLGYLFGHTAERVGLPEITGFLAAGLLMGPSVAAVISSEVATELLIITEIALGLICFTIGAELYLPKLRRVGRQVGWITAGQIGVTFLLVFGALSLIGVQPTFPLLLAATAGTTSPAATVVIVRSLRARGVYVDYLFGTVALGDAAAIVLFSILLAVAGVSLGIHAAASAVAVVISVAANLALSLVLGVAGGMTIHAITRRQESSAEILIVTVGVVLLGTAVAAAFDLSPLLLNITCGAVVANIASRNSRIFRTIEPLTPPIYALFFVIAGTKLRPTLFLQPELLLGGGVYVIGRAVGKYTGAWVGAKINRVDPAIRRWIGVSLLPQAGIALGLVLMLQLLGEGAGPEIEQAISTAVNVVLFAVFINEVLGPPLSRHATLKGNRMEAT